MYVVMLACSMDEIPVCLALSREEAISCVRELNTDKDIRAILNKYQEMTGCVATEPVSWRIAGFVDGVIDSVEVIIGEDDLACEEATPQQA